MKDRELWLVFAFESAFFAGLTVVRGKVGVAGINSEPATLIRTVVILLFIAVPMYVRAEPARTRCGSSAAGTLIITMF